MDPSHPSFLHHGIQGRLGSGIQSNFNAVENNSANLPGPADMTFQDAGSITRQSQQLVQSDISTDAGNRGGPMGFAQFPPVFGVPQWSLSHELLLPDHTTYAPTGTFNPSFGLNHTSTTFSNYGPAMTQNSTLPEDRIYLPPIPSLNHRSPRNVLPRSHEQCQPIAAEIRNINPGRNGSEIGVVFADGTFACVNGQYIGKNFSRCAELWRHYESFHDPHSPRFWCNVATCKRNMQNGGKPFKRPDKFKEHMRQKHHGE